ARIVNIHRHEVNRWHSPAKIIKTAFERLHLRIRRPSPFRKDDQRFASLQDSDKRGKRIVRARDFLSFDQDPSKYGVRQKKTNAPLLPVVTSGNGANGPGSLSGQNRPKHQEIQIARVIGKINALRGVRLAADPSRLNSREEPYTFCQQLRDHVLPGTSVRRGVGKILHERAIALLSILATGQVSRVFNDAWSKKSC